MRRSLASGCEGLILSLSKDEAVLTGAATTPYCGVPTVIPPSTTISSPVM